MSTTDELLRNNQDFAASFAGDLPMPPGKGVAVIRSLTISQRLLGTREVVLIHHTDCGMLTSRTTR